VPNQIHVVGAVVVRDGLILCAQRGFDGSLPGLWEFPGGKIEPGETKPEALKREMAEELGVEVEVDDEVNTTTYSYDFGDVTLTTFYCRLLSGAPRLTEHASIQWLSPGDLRRISWAPADLPAVAKVQADLS
jgi:8-oxo-dGTP diphosphatase